MKIHCKYDVLVDPITLHDHPKNRNKHNEDQIKQLAKIYKYQGIRHPIIVSKQSNYIVAGHGRRLAAVLAGLKEFPVEYQDFEDEDQEYLFIQSDNAIALQAELDLSMINQDIKDLGPFDIDLLGIKDFVIDPSELGNENINNDDEINPESEIDSQNEIICPSCNHKFQINSELING